MKITILNGVYQGKEFDFTTPVVTIGRDGGNQLILDTDGVSRCHAKLQQLPDGQWEVKDLNSTNGVKLDGRRIDGPVVIHEGVKLQVGENLLLVSDLSQEPPQVIFNPIISITPPAEEPGDQMKVVLPSDPVSSIQEKEQAKAMPDASQPANPAAWDVSKISGSLFGGKNASDTRGKQENAPSSSSAVSENDAKKRRSNMIFYAIVTCVVIMILSFAFSVIAPKKKTQSRVVQEKPLIVRYEKQIISKDNVFRFDFHLKNGIRKYSDTVKTKDGEKNVQKYRREYTLCFTIDDIASQRHFSREVPVSDGTVEQLRAAVSTSGVLAASQNPVAKDNSYNRTLTIVEGNKLVQISVPGDYGSNEFTAVEDAIIEVTESFGLKTISLTPKQLIEQAEKHFYKAEELFSNPSRLSNLRDAVKSYKIVVETLEQFSPKPPMWDKARRQLEAAVKQRDLKMGAYDVEYKRLLQVKDLAGMRQVFLAQMELADPESREYSVAKRRMVYIEQLLRKNKGRR